MRPPNPIRAAARSRGDKTYRDRSCIHGHEPIHYVSNGQCVACSRASEVRRKANRNRFVQQVTSTPTYVVLADWRVVTP